MYDTRQLDYPQGDPELRRMPFTWFSNEIFDNYAKPVGIQAWAVYTALCRFLDQQCADPTEQVADSLGLSKEAVLAAIVILNKHGLVVIHTRNSETIYCLA